MVASLEVRFHARTQVGVNRIVKIIGDLLPHVPAIDHYHSVSVRHHGLTFFQKVCLPVIQAPSMPGARASRNCKRARSRRVLTDASVMPSALAVSTMLASCMSRR